MTREKPLRRVSMPATHAAAVKRVLRLVDGYASTEEDHLMTWRGGLTTWADLRQHIQAAIKLMPNTQRARRTDGER